MMKLKLLVALIVALMLAACGGNAPAATATTAPDTTDNGGTGDTSDTGDSAAGDPAEVVKGYYAAAYGEGDLVSYFCSTNAAAADAIRQAAEQTRATFAQTQTVYDTSGLTFETVSQDAESAQVSVGGELKVTVAGNAMPAQAMPDGITHNLVNENGSWKICG